MSPKQINLFAELVVTSIDVFDSRTEFWQPGKFKGAWVVFGHFAEDVGNGQYDGKTAGPNFIDQKHDMSPKVHFNLCN